MGLATAVLEAIGATDPDASKKIKEIEARLHNELPNFQRLSIYQLFSVTYAAGTYDVNFSISDKDNDWKHASKAKFSIAAKKSQENPAKGFRGDKTRNNDSDDFEGSYEVDCSQNDLKNHFKGKKLKPLPRKLYKSFPLAVDAIIKWFKANEKDLIATDHVRK